MLRNEVKEQTESENVKRKLAALQTKGQKRWRAKGVDLEALMSQYNKEIEGETNQFEPLEAYEEESSEAYPENAKAW